MLLRRFLVFACLTAAHYGMSYLAVIIYVATEGGFPPVFIFFILFFPMWLSDVTGVGVIPFGDDALLDTPWAIQANSLLWAMAVYGPWLMWCWVRPGLYWRVRTGVAGKA